MVNLITTLLPYTVILANLVAVILVAALIARNSWGRKIIDWIGKHALLLGFLVSLSAVLGSLFYSSVKGFEPCDLCWWQRTALYPTLVLFAVALKKHDRSIFTYILPLSLIASVVAIYNSYIQWGGSPLVPCDPNNPCTKLYVYEFGYVTIPIMSLSIAVLLIILYFINKSYINENRNA